jgi:23S rRNA (guanosine2251-2'-O)-methyltransferase
VTRILYGIHPVKEALKASLPLREILLSATHPNPALQEILALAEGNAVPVRPADRRALDQMSGGRPHQSVIAVAEEFRYTELEDLLACLKKAPEKPLLLILDEIQDPQNLGALLRTALGCGAHGVILPKDRSADMTPAAMKASAGAAVHIPASRVTNLARTIDLLKEQGLWVFGAAGEAETPLFKIDFTVPLAVVIGSEGKGLRPLVRKKCDGLFSIPMKTPLASFNASVAGGMILYEVARQRLLAGEKRAS